MTEPTPYDAAQLVAAVRACLDAGDRAGAEGVALLSLVQAYEWGRTAEVRVRAGFRVAPAETGGV
jgi:hypothetical protein